MGNPDIWETQTYGKPRHMGNPDILTNAHHAEYFCPHIWEKTIPALHMGNLHIQNPDIWEKPHMGKPPIYKPPHMGKDHTSPAYGEFTYTKPRHMGKATYGESISIHFCGFLTHTSCVHAISVGYKPNLNSKTSLHKI
jgi:hypothetical protein